MQDDIFAKLDKANTDKANMKQSLKELKKALGGSDKNILAETGAVIQKICNDKQMDFKELCLFLADMTVTFGELKALASRHERIAKARTEHERTGEPNE